MKTVLYSMLLACSVPAMAQQVVPCHTMEHMEELFLQDPLKRAVFNEEEKKFEEILRNNPELQTQGGPRIIPVVFHIIHVGGTENISKAQVLDQMRILNEDFRRLNPDTVNTPGPFKPLAGDANIEFRLAQKDPSGNCTDGIVRKYSPLSVNARDNVKAVSYWPATKYFNIWVVKSIDANGNPGTILGYAQFPNLLPISPGTDGVVLRHDVVGDIGTAATGPFANYNGRTLCHEAGHWLNLRHIWGDAVCGNDQVSDTPTHLGANSGCPTFPYNVGSQCNPGPNGEMYVNYMDYTDGNCQNMFSVGQCTRMNTTLSGARANIWSASNLTATGTDGSPAVLCAPVAQISPFVPALICAGDSVLFKDMSYNGTVSNRNWSFQGGSPSSSTDSTEYVTYSTPGIYSVTLTVSNTAGTNTATKTGWIVVSAGTAQYSTWNYYEGFDASQLPSDWAVYNLGGDAVTWTITNTASWFGGSSVRYVNSSGLTGQVDELISPSVNMTSINSPKLYYYVSYAQRDANSDDKLRILVSIDCGEMWTQRSSKSGSILKTVNPQTASFIPTQASQWRLETVSLAAYQSAAKLKVKFEFTSDGGNNIYVDHINMTGTLGMENTGADPFGMNVFPNPVEGFSQLLFTTDGPETIRISLNDVMGREVKEILKGEFSGETQLAFHSGDLAPGIYLLTLEHNGNTYVKKLVIR
ncbi:MAG: T9SS type A sorting domain-containing protein [Bacteroidia bacterium]|nr:T9SS type A sorting domain-containing protein [Bacteroidia bacterium]